MTTKTNNKLNLRTLPHADNQLRAVKNSDGTTTVDGYAIVFDQPSQPLPFIEYISRDALKGVDFSSTLFLYAHDYNKILARADSGTLKTQIDDKGLKFTAQLPNTTLGNDTRENINSGNVKGCSFGFTIAEDGDRWATADDGTTVHYVDKIATVDELTLTPIPAYTQTSVTVQRDLQAYLNKEEKRSMETSQNSSAVSSAASTTSTASSVTSSTASSSSVEDIVSRAVSQAVSSAVSAVREACGSTVSSSAVGKRDDADDPDVIDSDEDVEDLEDDAVSNSASPESTASQSSSSQASSVASSASAESSASSTASSTASRAQSQNEKENIRMINITPNQNEKEAQLTRDFGHYLRTHEIRESLRDAAAGVGLSYGSVLIPKTFLPAEHENHQFPRLEQFVKTVQAPTTTGQWSYFAETSDVLETKAEFDHAKDGQPKGIKTVVWNLQTLAKKYPISKELISDSKSGVTPNWISEIQQTIQDLNDNTNDKLISDQFNADGVNHITATDAIADMKKVLNVNLKPLDSAQAQIILSQSAFNALDQLKDNFGRPLLQPDPSSATANRLFGKPVIIVADELLGKAGEANAVIAPLSKAIVDFQNDEVTGQFLDNFDVFENILGIYVRKDVKAVRPELINTIKLTDKSIADSQPTTVGAGK